MAKLGGAPTAIVAAVTAGCGLLLIGGVGPSMAGSALDGERPPEAAALALDRAAQVAETSVPDTSVPDTSVPVSVLPPEPPGIPSPVPLSVAPPSVTVGPGGTARLSGTCPLVDGAPLGPVEVWVVGEVLSVIGTGVTASEWSYDWTAPDEPAEIVLQVWCGDPADYRGGYPESMQIEVVFVAQVPATTAVVAAEPRGEIPATD